MLGLFVLLSASRPALLPAQVSLHATVGARYSTPLVHDSIVAPVDVQPAIGPALRLSLGEGSSSVWTPNVNLDVSWASLRSHEGGATEEFNSITTLAMTVGVRRKVVQGLTAGADLGILKYLPSEESGLFRSGSGVEALVGLGLYWTPAAARAHDIGLSLRYDVHQFTTQALHDEGFTNPQLVHRVSLAVGARVLGTGGNRP